MERYRIRYFIKGYNWPVQEVIVSRKEAAKIMADDSLLILRIEKLPWK